MPPPLRILYAASEYAPLAKTGGLGDVAGALPAALRGIGLDARVLLPGYPAVLAGAKGVRKVATLPPLGGLPAADLLEAAFPHDVPGWIVAHAALYERGGGPYQDAAGAEWDDNARRFGLLSHAAASLGAGVEGAGFVADVVHANDWQTGLAPAYAALATGRRAASVFTIHNLAFQGVYPAGWVAELGLPPSSFAMHGVEYHGHLSFLKAGLYYADAITTVSPTYAEEIQRDAGGMGLQGLLADRRGTLTGILNGIDTTEWDPRTDPFLARGYGPATLEAKTGNKRALQDAMGLAIDDDAFLLGVVARFSAQKGLDLLADIAPTLAALPVQLAVLGSGDAGLERRLREIAGAHAGTIAVVTGFDEGLAHRIEAGADAFVMPSRFEPCGLNQMYSQRYGTPPIVHATGGLVDSVVDCSPATLAAGTATGFAFRGATAAALLGGIRRALAAYRDRPTWRALQRNGMARDFGWASAAARYEGVYRDAVARAAAPIPPA